MKSIKSRLSQLVPEEELQGKVLWRSLGVIIWVSFLFAGLASILFFATFDPEALINTTTFSLEWSAQAVYTMGFALFWLFGISSTLTSVFLLSLPLEKRQKSLPE